MHIVIADDEPLARKRLIRLLEQLPGLELAGEATNGKEAITLCSKFQPDIILLDIRMPEMDGIQAAQQLSTLDRPPAIIFTTAFDNHALAAFETHAVAYLLKPVRREQLQQAIEKAQRLNRAQLAQLQQSQNEEPVRSHLNVQLGNTTQLIPIDEIDFFRAEQKYVAIYKHGQQFLIDTPLKELEDEFSKSFIRIHRNALVAKKAINKLHNSKQFCKAPVRNYRV